MNQAIQALILAGGFGTRLSKVVQDVPKPMAPVQGRPFLEYLIQHLVQHGVTDICLLTGYKAHVITEHFGDGSRFGAKIRYSHEDTPLGTGGAVKKALEGSDERQVLILNGDSFFDLNLTDFIRIAAGRDALALTYTEDVRRYGAVQISDDYQLQQFKEKDEQLTDGLINAGVYLLSSDYFDRIEARSFSLETEILYRLTEHLIGLPMAGFFIDIGVPDSFYHAGEMLAQRIQDQGRPCLFLDRDGTLIDYEPYLYKPSDVRLRQALIPLLDEARARQWLIGLVSNQAGVARGTFSVDDVMRVEERLKALLKKHKHELDFCLYSFYHPNFPESRALSGPLTRKPAPGNLLKVSQIYKIKMSESFMIGDNTTDLILLPELNCKLIESTLEVNRGDLATPIHTLSHEIFK